MATSFQSIAELDKILFIDAMNEQYHSPQEIEYRVPAEFKNDKLPELIMAIRKQKSESFSLLANHPKELYSYCKTSALEKLLFEVETYRNFWKPVHAPHFFNERYIENLIDEAQYSARLEGVKIQRERVEALVRQSLIPQNPDEQLCVNHFRAMDYVLNHLERKLDEDFIAEIQVLLCKNLFEKTGSPEALCYKNEEVREKFNAFLNGIHSQNSELHLLNPLVVASAIHCFVFFLDPFSHSKRPLARLLATHFLINQGYPFMKYFSLTKSFAFKKIGYDQALSNVSKFENDLSYFVLFYLKNLCELLVSLQIPVEKIKDSKVQEEAQTRFLNRLEDSGICLNPRQEKLFSIHFRKKIFPLTIKKYQKINPVVYETARTDLSSLCEKGLLKMEKKGREFVFKLSAETSIGDTLRKEF